MGIAKLEVVEGGSTDKVGSYQWSNRLRRRTKMLVKQLETGYMELAKLLWQIYDVPVDGDPNNGPLYRSWGYASYNEYAETELGIHYKKAHSLKRIYERFGEGDLATMEPSLRDRIIGLGWSKVRELVRGRVIFVEGGDDIEIFVLTLDNAAEWADRIQPKDAKEMPYPMLCSAIQHYLADLEAAHREALETGSELPSSAIPVIPAYSSSEDRNPDDFSSFKFAVTPDQQKTVEAALDRASLLSNSDWRKTYGKKGHNLELICTDFLATNDFGSGTDPDRLVKYLAKIETALGIKLIATTPDLKKIVYGVLNLSKMASEED